MTEQEARTEAVAILKPLAKRHRARTDFGHVEESYVEYWPAVKAVAEMLSSQQSPPWSCAVEGCTLKPLHTHGEFEPNEWSRLVAEERAHQVEAGYDAKHDREHGLEHLLGWAEDYLRRDRRVEAGALIRAAREVWERSRVVAAPSDTEPVTEAQISAVTIAIQVHALGETWGDDGVAFVGCDCGEWFGKSTEDGWDRARRHVARMALNVSRLTPVQPVQVEVTEQAVVTLAKHMANVASDWTDICDDDDHPLEHSNREAYTDDARAALAALGGGDHG